MRVATRSMRVYGWWYGLISCAFVALILAANFYFATPVEAAFNRSRIIDNAVFTDHSSMSITQIQNFLNSKVPACDSDGSEPSEYGGGTRAQYGTAHGFPPPYICLKNYSQNNKSAARIIYEAAQEFRISPKVLIVLLQKEQGLVTDEWPAPVQYKTAAGYGCPDTAACDSQYYGFTNQVRWAARMFRAIMDASPSWYTPYIVGNNRIYYHPDLNRCGSSTVTIENRATAALYNYTPYQPNTAALNAGFGTGNSCSSYGNRNFYLYFTNWFGSTQLKYISLEQPRWMRTRVATYKKNPDNGANVDSQLSAGQEIYFSSKVKVGGNWYIRTKHDTASHINKGILLSDLEEIPVSYVSLQTPRWLVTSKDVRKIDPITSRIVSSVIPAGTQIYFSTKTEIGGNVYLRTKHDTDENAQTGVPISALDETVVAYEPFDQPRWLEARTDTYLYDIKSTNNTGSKIPQYADRYFNYKITVNSKVYARNNTPTSANEFTGVPLSTLKEVSLNFIPLKDPRWLLVENDDTYKKDPRTEGSLGYALPQNTELEFDTKVTVGNKVYLRTKSDTLNGINRGFLLEDLMEAPLGFTPLHFVPLKLPRQLAITIDTQKKYPATGANVGTVISAGTILSFDTKVLVGGVWYLRTTEDSTMGIDHGILLSELEEVAQ